MIKFRPQDRQKTTCSKSIDLQRDYKTKTLQKHGNAHWTLHHITKRPKILVLGEDLSNIVQFGTCFDRSDEL